VIKIWSGRNQLEDCRKYSDVCWLTSHNATVSTHYGYSGASFGQAEDLDTQLDGGVRAFTFDCWSQTSLNAPNASNAYYDLRDQRMIPDMVYAFSNPKRSGGEGDDLPGIAWPNGGVYNSRFDQWMSQIGTFLNRNPSEVVTIFLEGNANQSEFDSSFYSLYMDPTVVKHIMNQDDYDNLHNLTLEEIRSRGRRLAIFHRGGTMNFNVNGHQFQFRSQYEKMVENKPTVLPTGINSCEKRDGSDDLNTGGRLKVYNHFGQAYHELINRRWYEHCTDMGVPNFLVVNNATESSNGVLPRDAVKEFNRLFAEKIVGGPRTYNILEDNSQTTNIVSEGGDGSHLLMGENLRNWEFTSGSNRTYRLRYHGTSSYLVAPIIGLNRCFIDSGYDPTERDNWIVEPLPDGKVRLVCEHNYGGGLQRALRVASDSYIKLSDNRDFGDVSSQKLELRPVLSLGISCLAQPQYVVVLLDQNYQGFLQPEAVKEQINYNGVCESDILLSLNQEVFSCEDIGWRTVTLTASDGAGLSSSCTASILVAEHNPPSITCPNTKILAANENCENTLGSHQPMSLTDDCTADGEITLFVNPGPGTVLSGHNDTVTVTMNAYDITGNAATCSFHVILKDQTAPSLMCKNHTAYLNMQGTLSLDPNDIYQSGTDNCGTVNLTGVLPSTLNCSNIGPNTVVLEGNDSNGNYGTCLATVTVVDNIAPTVVCKTHTAFLNAAGTASVVPADLYQSGADNCSVVNQVSVSPNAFTCANIGANTVSLTVNDGHGNTASCSTTVTVVDNIAPSVVCKPFTAYLDNAGAVSIVSNDVFQNGADNCGTVNLASVTPNSFNCSNLGANLVALTVNDGHNNTASCNATVTVADNLAPAVVCKTFTAFLNAAGNVTITPADVFQSGADNCGTVNLGSVSPSSFTCAQIGANPVTLTVNDGHGNGASCNTFVTVKDAIIPTMLCKNATLYLNSAGQATLTIAQVNNGSFDNCAITFMGLSQTLYSCANVGQNTVSLSGVDQSQNKGVCTATITVLDAILPTTKCKNLTANLNVNGSVTVTTTSINNGSFDNCSFTQTLTPNTFGCSNVGANNVILRSTDASGNTSTCSAIVTVKDVNAPNALCKNATIYVNDAGNATLNTSHINNGSSDACGISTMTLSKTQFNCSDLPGSSQTVTLTLKDVNNNTSSCNAQVTTKDNLAPTAVCQNTTVTLSNGSVTVYGANLAANSFDNCSVWSYSPVAKVYTAIGVYNLVITVKDWSNNAATCTSVVTVSAPFGGDGDNRDENALPTVGADLTLYPNPSSGDATLVFQLPTADDFSVRVFDMTGRLVFSHEGIAVEGENSLPIRLNGIAAGVYLLDFQSKNKKAQKRLVVQD